MFRWQTGYEDSGEYEIEFFVSDGELEVSEKVSLVVVDVNRGPVAYDQSVSLDEDGELEIILSGSDEDDDSLTYEKVDSPIYGVLIGIGQNVVYVPNENYQGDDSFTFIVNDEISDSNVAVVSIEVEPVNPTRF